MSQKKYLIFLLLASLFSPVEGWVEYKNFSEDAKSVWWGCCLFSVSWSPDSKFIAASSFPGIKIWDVSSEEAIHLSSDRDVIYSLSWSPDGELIAAAGVPENGTPSIYLWRPDGTLERKISDERVILSLAWSKDSERIAAGYQDGRIKIWRKDGKLLLNLSAHDEQVSSLSWNGYLVSGSGDKKVKIWKDGEGVRTLPEHPDLVKSVAVSPDGRYIASGSYQAFFIWDISGSLIKEVKDVNRSYIVSLSWSPDGKYLATGSYPSISSFVLVEVGTGKVLLEKSGPPVHSVAFSPDGSMIALGRWDNTVIVYKEEGYEILLLLLLPVLALMIFFARRMKKGKGKGKGKEKKEGKEAQVSLDFLFGVTIFLITFIYVALYLPGMFAPFESESDVTTLLADKVASWMVEGELVDNRANPNVVNSTKLEIFLSRLSAEYEDVIKEAGLFSERRSFDLNITVDYLNGTVKRAGEKVPEIATVAQTRRWVRIDEQVNETNLTEHVVIQEVYYFWPLRQYVVLYNPTREQVNLSGWSLSDGAPDTDEGVAIFPPGTYIAPRSYLWLTRDMDELVNELPGCTPDFEWYPSPPPPDTASIPNMISDGSMSLGSNDELFIQDDEGNLVDAVVWGTGGGDVPGGWAGTPAPSAGMSFSIYRIYVGYEGSGEPPENQEDLQETFSIKEIACPPSTSAIISIKVW